MQRGIQGRIVGGCNVVISENAAVDAAGALRLMPPLNDCIPQVFRTADDHAQVTRIGLRRRIERGIKDHLSPIAADYAAGFLFALQHARAPKVRIVTIQVKIPGSETYLLIDTNRSAQ